MDRVLVDPSQAASAKADVHALAARYPLYAA